MERVYYTAGILIFQTIVATILISLINRYNPYDHRSSVFLKLIYSYLSWAAFDMIMAVNQVFIPHDIAFRLFGVLSFMFLISPAFAVLLTLSLIRELKMWEKTAVFLPFVALYISILLFPEYSSAKTFGIKGGYIGPVAPWNFWFKTLTLSISSGCIGLLLISSLKDSDRTIRKEKQLLSFGGLVFLFSMVISQALITVDPRMPWFSNLCTIFFNVSAYAALKRYGRILSSRDLYETIVKISPNGIAHIYDGRIIWMNRSMVDLLGLPDWRDRNVEDILHDIQPNHQNRKDIIEDISKGLINSKMVYFNSTGTEPVACMVNCALLEPANPLGGLLLVLTDISEENRIKKELSDMNVKLDEMAHIDSLTEIPNRRVFDNALSSELKRAKRNKSELGFLIIDIDFFKKYNDLYGHRLGDICLYNVAQEIDRHAKRPADLACRIGGEEFCLILPDTSINGAAKISEMIREGVENLRIPHGTSSVSSFVTVSIGLCHASDLKDITYKKIYNSADKALYMAKESGRNNVNTVQMQGLKHLF